MRARLLILGCALLFASDAGATRTPGFVPQSIAFWDANRGVATFVACAHPACANEIATTADGGTHWKVRARLSALGDVTLVRGTDEAWVEAQGGSLHTSDGGLTWTRVRRTAGLTGLTFPASRDGYAVRGRQYELELVRTSDRGRTWHRTPLPCGRLNSDAFPAFATRRHGWILCAGQPSAGSQSKAIYETGDGGRRWRRLPPTDAVGLRDGGYAHAMSMSPSGAGLIWEARGSTFRTENGARTWWPVGTTSPEEREGISGWVVSGRTSYLLVWDNSRRDVELMRSDDGAHTWHRIRSWSRR